MPTAFTPNIPSDGQTLGNSKTQVRGNFTNYKENMEINHVDINDADYGKHKFLQMPEQGAAPATAANEAGLYTKSTADGTALFFREESSGTEQQLTGSITKAATGHTVLPGGILLNWGWTTGFNSGGTITWDKAFTTFYTVTLSRMETGDQRGFVQIKAGTTPTTTNATVIVRDSGGSQINGQTIGWIAIGLL